MKNVAPEVEAFISGLSPEDIKWLEWILRAAKRVDGWCSINRIIGRWLIFTIIAAVVLLSNGYDAFARFISFLRGH